MRLRFAFLLISLLVFLGRPVWAHPMPNSQVMLDINRNAVALETHVPLTELEIAYEKPLSQDPQASLAHYHDDLMAYFARHVSATSPDGKTWRVAVQGVERGEDETPPGWTHPTPFLNARILLTPPEGESVRHFTLQYDAVVHQLVTHIAMVSVRRDWNNGVFSGSPVVLGEVRDRSTTFSVDIPSGSPWRGFASVFHLGTRHIAEGTDHLLFLLVLLLPAALLARNKHWAEPAPVGRSVRNLVKIVTAFTIGHSITLAVCALGLVHAPSAPVETLIALSIFVSAVHALRPLFPGREAVIAGLFGLVHGAAFAEVVSEFHLDLGRTVLAILGFNVGIEAMQLFVVAITVPWLLLLSRTPAYTPVRVGGAVIAGIAALGWMGERALGLPNPVGPLVEAAAAHAVWMVAGLAVLSLAAYGWQRKRAASQPTTPDTGIIAFSPKGEPKDVKA